MSSAVGLCRPLSAQSFHSPQPTLHPWPEQSFLPASNFAGRIHGRKWLGRWAAGGGLGWGLPPRGSLGASSLGTCVACSHTLLPNFCRASEPDPDAPSDGGGVCGLPAISPGIITLSEWGKPAINSGRQPTTDMVPETTGPRSLLTPVPLNLSCQNSIFFYTSCCVSKLGLQQQITTNLKKPREVYSLTVLETRCPKSRCQQG